MEPPARARLRKLIEKELPDAVDAYEAEEEGLVSAEDGLRDAVRAKIRELESRLKK